MLTILVYELLARGSGRESVRPLAAFDNHRDAMRYVERLRRDGADVRSCTWSDGFPHLRKKAFIV
jgi:hypothetical protein